MKLSEKHDLIVEICKTAVTFTEIESRLGVSTPHKGIRKYIKINKIEIPCFLGQKIGCQISQKSRNNITEKALCENSPHSTGAIKRFLVKNKIKELKCEKCGWCEKRKSDGKIPVHLHHINGDSSDNRLVNLQFLCPNCHSLTDNYCGKNSRNPKREKEFKARQLYYLAPKQECEVCGKLGYGNRFCSEDCKGIGQRKCKWPTKEQLQKDIETISWLAIGRKYGVSDNAARKWAKKYKILKGTKK